MRLQLHSWFNFELIKFRVDCYLSALRKIVKHVYPLLKNQRTTLEKHSRNMFGLKLWSYQIFWQLNVKSLSFQKFKKKVFLSRTLLQKWYADATRELYNEVVLGTENGKSEFLKKKITNRAKLMFHRRMMKPYFIAK